MYHDVPPDPKTQSGSSSGEKRRLMPDILIFVSPITDQFGRFDFEVTPTQNYAASFNAGIAAGHLLCALPGFVKEGNPFGIVKN